MAIDIGRIAYDKYAEKVDYINYNGKNLPKWEDLGKVGQDAWRHAACAVLDYMHQCEEDMKEDLIG
jgi:hypothetical protein